MTPLRSLIGELTAVHCGEIEKTLILVGVSSGAFLLGLLYQAKKAATEQSLIQENGYLVKNPKMGI